MEVRQMAPERRGTFSEIFLITHVKRGPLRARVVPRSHAIARKGRVAMAGPQSFTPSSITPSRTTKRFTLAEANKSLPYVSRVVKDLVNVSRAINVLQQKIEKKGGKDRINGEKELAGSKDRLQCLIEELGAVGAQLKDSRSGLIDFIGRHKGHDVCLCWRLGEAKVTFFHEMDSGFAGRQPVAALQECE